MIHTKCMFVPPDEADGMRICVANSLPKPHKGVQPMARFSITLWIPGLGTGTKLRRLWKEFSISWETFTERYLYYVTRYRKPELTYLWRQHKIEDLTLLCWEKEDNPHCHRHILKKLILSK